MALESAPADADESIGLAAGGAADVGTFRRNVHEGYLPIPESMAYEGLFGEYYFDVGGDGTCGSLFCPTYTPAASPDPLSCEDQLSEWELQSEPLVISERYESRIGSFREQFAEEKAAIGDDDLAQELG